MFAIRHCKKRWSNRSLKESTDSKQHDSPISKDDIDKLMKEREKMIQEGGIPDAIYSSPFLRCRETAALLSCGTIPIFVDPLLSECLINVPKNQTIELEEETERLLAGMTLRENKKECVSRISKIKQRDYIKKRVWIVSHGLTIMILFEVLFGRKCEYLDCASSINCHVSS